MARTTQTYAIRLAVEDGGRVKAELLEVGRSGERSLSRIGTGAGEASRSLGALTDRARSLRTTVAALAGSLAGAVTAGGLALLIDRSLEAADAVAKTADSIGISTKALQEYRFAAGLSGVETERLDAALQFFTKTLGEARLGTGTLAGKLKDANRELLAQLASASSTEEALQIFIRALDRTSGAQDRLALAAAGFGRGAGAELVNIVRDGAEAFEGLRARANDLGLVIDEALLRKAEEAKDSLEVLGMVLSARLTVAVAENAEAIARLAGSLTDAAIGAAKFLGLIERAPLEKLARIASEIERLERGPLAAASRFLFGPSFAERKLRAEQERLRDELAASTSARNAIPLFTRPPAGIETPAAESPLSEAEAAARARRETELARIAVREEEAARRRAEANRKVIESLDAERAALSLSERERFVEEAQRRLSADATEEQRRRVRELAGALFDEKQAIEAANKAAEDANRALEERQRRAAQLFEETRDPAEKYAATQGELSGLLRDGLIDWQTYSRALEDARGALDKTAEATDGMAEASLDLSRAVGTAFEDAVIRLGTLRDIGRGFVEDIQRIILRATATKPIQNAFERAFGGFDLFSLFGGGSSAGALTAAGRAGFGLRFPIGIAHAGGVIGEDAFPSRLVPALAFAGAPRFGSGGIAGSEVPAVLHRGEGVFTPAQMKALGGAARPVVNVVYNVDARGAAPGVEQRIVQALRELDRSVETRAVRAVQNARARDPGLFRS